MTPTSQTLRRSAGLLFCLLLSLTAGQSAWAKPAKAKTAAVKTSKATASKAAKSHTKQARLRRGFESKTVKPRENDSIRETTLPLVCKCLILRNI